MSLTVQNLSQIIGGLTDTGFEQHCLDLADEHVTMFLKRDGGVFFSGDSGASDHHVTIGKLARAIQAEPWDRLQGQIRQLDKVVNDLGSAAPFPTPTPSEAIAEALCHTNRAAYYFGIAMALRLMGGAR